METPRSESRFSVFTPRHFLRRNSARRVLRAAGHAPNHGVHIHDERENHDEGDQRVDLLGIHGNAEQPVARALNRADDHASSDARKPITPLMALRAPSASENTASSR